MLGHITGWLISNKWFWYAVLMSFVAVLFWKPDLTVRTFLSLFCLLAFLAVLNWVWTATLV